MQSIEQIRFRYLRFVVAPLMRLAGARVATGIARRLARGIYAMNPPGRAWGIARVRAAIEAGLFEFCARGDGGGQRGAKIDGSIEMPEIRHDAGNRWTARDVESIVSASYEHFGRFWAETIFVPARMKAPRWRKFVRIADEAAMRRFADDARGRIVAVGYHGNIAAAACVLGALMRPIHVVVDSAQVAGISAWRKLLNSQPHVQVIERSVALDHVPAILEAGGVVMLVAEHERVSGRGVPVTFMGRLYDAYPTIGLLSKRYDAPVGVVTCRRIDGAFGFELALEGIVEPGEHGQPDGVVRSVLRTLEAGFARSPEQYLWSQAFLRPQVTGATDADSPRALASSSLPVSKSMNATTIVSGGGSGTQARPSRVTDMESESASYPRRD